MRRYSRKKNSTKIFVVVTLAAALIFGLVQYLTNRSNNVVAAEINGEKIFKSEIQNKLREVFASQNLGLETQTPEVEKMPQEVIEIIAKEIYLERELTKEAKKSPAAKTKEVMDRANEAYNRVLRQAYVESILSTEVSDQKISEKYAELSSEVNGKKEYEIAHILVKTKEEAEKLAKELKAKKSPKFSELAKKNSIDQDSAGNGGNLGYVLETNLVKEIADIIPNLKNNEVSSPVQSKFGWHLVKLLNSRDATAAQFEDVKENIRAQLIQNTISEINSRITKDAKVKILLKSEEPKAEVKEEAKPEEAAKTEDENNNTQTNGEEKSAEVELEKSDEKKSETKSKK